MATIPVYKATFPAIPRANGVAAVTVAGAAPEGTTVVHFLTKEEIAGNFTGAAAADAEKESVNVVYEGGARVVYASIGAAKSVNLGSVKGAATAAVNKLRLLKVGSADFRAPAVEGIPAAKLVEGIVQAAALTNFAFDRYLTTEAKVPSFLSSIHVALPAGVEGAEAAAATAAGREAAVYAEATIYARDLCNERSDEMHPARVEEEARKVAAAIGAEVYVCAGTDLLKENLHLLYSVGQCAREAPRYVELRYKGDPEHPADVIMLVGKCITYDTGGLNIKGTGFMEDMHMDMGGASAVLGAMLAIGRLGLKRNVVAIAAVAENAIGENAYKPKAIIRSHKGYTVEIGNTDAEGRLVLADALSYGQARNKPHTIIDLATLTGACIIGLGEYAAGMFTNNTALKEGLLAASGARSERLWPMPIFPEHREELKAAAQADLQSTGAGRYGGACTAAAFLENFIGHEPAVNAREGAPAGSPPAVPGVTPAWAHLDIAGPAMYGKARGYMNAGGTGFGAQVITQYVASAAAGSPAADIVAKY